MFSFIHASRFMCVIHVSCTNLLTALICFHTFLIQVYLIGVQQNMQHNYVDSWVTSWQPGALRVYGWMTVVRQSPVIFIQLKHCLPFFLDGLWQSIHISCRKHLTQLCMFRRHIVLKLGRLKMEFSANICWRGTDISDNISWCWSQNKILPQNTTESTV